MANPGNTLYEDKAMQESGQELTHYYKNIITLKSGVQIEICTTKFYDEIEYSALDDMMVIDGFIKNPLPVKKTVKIDRVEIAALEIVTDPCIAQVIPWPESETVPAMGMAGNKHPEDCGCGECPGVTKEEIIKRCQAMERLECGEEPLVEHKPTCAIHNNPDSAGFASSVSDCDCSAQ